MNARTPSISAQHAQHNRWLVVRFASHDVLDAAESSAVQAQLASCTDCAALVDDLATIARATAMSATPARPRDFRITHDKLAARRGSLLRRVLDGLASPGAAVVRPLAGATLAIGLVLVVVSTTLPGAGSPTRDDRSRQAAHSAAVGEATKGNPEFGVTGAGPVDGATKDPDGVLVQRASDLLDPQSAYLGSVAPSYYDAAAIVPKATEATDLMLAADASLTTDAGLGPIVLIVGTLLAIASAALLALTWAARRVLGVPHLR